MSKSPIHFCISYDKWTRLLGRSVPSFLGLQGSNPRSTQEPHSLFKKTSIFLQNIYIIHSHKNCLTVSEIQYENTLTKHLSYIVIQFALKSSFTVTYINISIRP